MAKTIYLEASFLFRLYNNKNENSDDVDEMDEKFQQYVDKKEINDATEIALLL